MTIETDTGFGGAMVITYFFVSGVYVASRIYIRFVRYFIKKSL